MRKFTEWQSRMREYLGDTINELLFPRHCPVCDHVVPYKRLICPECYPLLHKVSEPACRKCGKPLKKAEEEYCTDCGVKKHFFTQGRAVFQYDGAMKQSIYRFKYANRQEYAEFYGTQAVKTLNDFFRQVQADLLVPVPLYAAKMRKRGFNQAQCFAQAISKYTGISVDTKTVVRIRNTTPQKELDELGRQNNLKKAFKIGRNDVKLKTIIVIDDIYTTGSTIDAVAQVLLEAGAKRVYFVVLATGK